MPSPGFVEQVSDELHADPGVEMHLPQLGSGDPWMPEEAATPLVEEALESEEKPAAKTSAEKNKALRARKWQEANASQGSPGLLHTLVL